MKQDLLFLARVIAIAICAVLVAPVTAWAGSCLKDTSAEMPWVILSKTTPPPPECKTSEGLWRKRYWSDLPTVCTIRTKTVNGCEASTLIKKYKQESLFLGVEGGISEAD